MSPLKPRLLAMLVFAFGPISVFDAIPPEIVAAGKNATALVEIAGGQGSGSAFCIDAAEGIFITNAHVANGLGNKGSVSLILHSGEANQKQLQAIIVRTDADLDLALLRVKDPKQLTALPLGSIDDLVETAAITAFGYPFGKELALAGDEYPSVTVSTGHITSLRKVKGTLAAGITVSLTLSAGPEDHRTVTSREADSQSYILHASPLPGIKGVNVLRVTAESPEGKVTCEAPDQSVKVGGKSVLLSTIKEIDRSDGQVRFVSKAIRAVPVSGLDNLETVAPGGKSHSNFSRAAKITIEIVDSDLHTISYKIVATQNGNTIGELTGTIPIVGVHVAASGQSLSGDIELLLATYDSDAVKRFNGRTGSFIDDIISGNGLSHPVDVVIGHDGNLYVSGNISETVHRFNGRTGQLIDVFVTSAGSGGIHGPNGLTFGPDGNLYVSSFWTREVKRYDGQTGKFIDNFVTSGSGGVDWPAYLMFGPDVNLYVGSIKTNCVKLYNGKTGDYIRDFVTGNGVANPNGFCFGSDGRFYLSNYDTKQIKRFDGNSGAFIDNFIGPDELGKEPTGLAFGPDGNLYVATRANDVKRFNGKTGQFIDVFISGNNINNPIYMLFRQTPGR